MEKTNLAMRVSKNTIIANALLSILKLLAGLAGHSAAMLSDAIHTISDVLSTVIVIIGVKLSGKEADEEHPYGHERFECVAAIILAAILCVTGAGIGYGGVQRILTSNNQQFIIPNTFALVAAIISIVIKEGMYWYTKAAAQKISSGALMADAWHHRSDALSSIGSFIGIFGAQLGFPILDSIACIVICLFIVKAAYDIFVNAVGKMTDRSCNEETVEAIHATIQAQTGVLCVDQLKTRLFGEKVYVDVEICADGNISLWKAHHIAHTVHDTIEQHFPQVKHCMVHVNPK